MKNFLRIPVLLVLLVAGGLLSGCAATAGVGYADVRPYYGPGPYYRPYYPRPYYRPYAAPYYRPYLSGPTVIVRPRPIIVAPAPRFYNYNGQPHRSIRVR